MLRAAKNARKPGALAVALAARTQNPVGGDMSMATLAVNSAADYSILQTEEDADQSQPVADWITVLVSLNKPDDTELQPLNRGERYDVLSHNAEEKRNLLLRWIKEQNLAAHFKRVGLPTLFSMIAIVCTPYAAQKLSHAPGVVNVVTAPNLSLDMDVIR